MFVTAVCILQVIKLHGNNLGKEVPNKFKFIVGISSLKSSAKQILVLKITHKFLSKKWRRNRGKTS